MTSIGRVGLVGATGFVGAAVHAELVRHGYRVQPVRAPRYVLERWPAIAEDFHPSVATAFSRSLDHFDAIVNCAGAATPTAPATPQLGGANIYLPAVLAAAAGGRPFIHISSAAVQGSAPLDSAPVRELPPSPYARSKALGEHYAAAQGGRVIVFRPPGVHAATRSVTRFIYRLGSSPLARVPAPGTANTPQTTLDSVARAVTYVLANAYEAPSIVHHPSDGLTVTSFLELLTGRRPKSINRASTAAILRIVKTAGALSPSMVGHENRLRLLWLGQAQMPSWLDSVPWNRPDVTSSWTKIRKELEHEKRERGNE